MSQLPLALKLKAQAAFASFVAGPNGHAIEHVRAVASGERPESIWLFGSRHTGKTHLLAAACREAGERGSTAMFLAPDQGDDPGLVAELEALDLIALDDMHRVAGLAAWEAALFSLFDSRLQRGGLIVTANAPPRECGFALPDLVSRAASMALYRLEYLGDEDLEAAVLVHARERGLSLDTAAVSYLLQRVSRDLGQLTGWLDRIDRHSLAEKRRVTIPLLREVIGP
jgi:DnaA family protein